MTDLTPATLTPDWQTEDGSIRLFCGDCLSVLPTLEAGSVDAVVTDPPYQSLDVEVSNGTTTRLVRRDQFGGKRLAASDGPTWFATMPDTEILEAISILCTLVGDDGAAYVFADVKTGLRCLAGARNIIVWDKCSIGMGYAWRRMHEWIGYFPGKNHRLRDMGRGDIIRFPTMDDKLHPTQKPVEVIVPLIENSTDEGDTVLDCFMGVASSGVACIRTGRKFIGIEKEEKYFRIAVKRITEELSRTRLFEPPPRFVQKTLMGDAT